MRRDGDTVGVDLAKSIMLYRPGCEADYGDKDCDTLSASYIEGDEILTEQERDRMKGRNKRSVRVCRSIYFPC